MARVVKDIIMRDKARGNKSFYIINMWKYAFLFAFTVLL